MYRCGVTGSSDVVYFILAYFGLVLILQLYELRGEGHSNSLGIAGLGRLDAVTGLQRISSRQTVAKLQVQGRGQAYSMEMEAGKLGSRHTKKRPDDPEVGRRYWLDLANSCLLPDFRLTSDFKAVSQHLFVYCYDTGGILKFT